MKMVESVLNSVLTDKRDQNKNFGVTNMHETSEIIELLNFCFKTGPFSSVLLSFDSNISTTIGQRVSQLSSHEVPFQDKDFKLSWVSIQSKMRLVIKIAYISLDLALHPAVRSLILDMLLKLTI